MEHSNANETSIGVVVQRLLPFGLLVTLDDGRAGIIREREIAWDHNERRHWREHFRPGDHLTAMMLRSKHEGRLELSLRMVRGDPWFDLCERHTLGQIVGGVVTGLQPYGIFVEIEPGVTGLVHRSRLPDWVRDEDVESLFWPGDRVMVAIEMINLRERRLGLSLRHALTRRLAAPETSAHPRAPEVDTTSARARSGARSIDLLHGLPARSLLVVEDDREQRDALIRWLRQAGQQVASAASAEEGLELLEGSQPDLVLMDVNLPGMSGIQGIAAVRERRPAAHCVLMTDWARASEHMVSLEELRASGVALLLKPLLPEDLIGALADTLDDGEAPNRTGPAMPLDADVAQRMPRGQASAQSLLAQLCAATYASKAVLFALDPAQRKIAVVAESGDAPLEPKALVDLIYSPVRDVAEDRQVARVKDSWGSESRVRYLTPLVDFRSCLGLPVPCDLAERYALFVFAPRPEAFGPARESHARATALALSALLERQQFESHVTDLQNLALVGQLSRALVHEMNHQLSPINFALGDLEAQCEQLTALSGAPVPLLGGELREAQEVLANLSRGVRRLTETARMFGQMTVQHQAQPIAPDAIVREATGLVRDMADRAHVTIEIAPAADLPMLHARAIQVHQILVNILINAVQQIALARPHEGGRVRIRLAGERLEASATLRIWVEDDGPGIHRRLWERIFELGFTTRRDGGSGLGLYVTRSLAEALGGRVAVAESFLLWGTTFLLELPAVYPGGGDADPHPR